MARDRAMTVNDNDNWFVRITNYFADSALNGVAPLPNDAYQGKSISKEEGIRTRAVAEATRSHPQRNDSKSRKLRSRKSVPQSNGQMHDTLVIDSPRLVIKALVRDFGCDGSEGVGGCLAGKVEKQDSRTRDLSMRISSAA
jgi:hypothetical protein